MILPGIQPEAEIGHRGGLGSGLTQDSHMFVLAGEV